MKTGKGFTLAEVLITLGIIGVVAAIVIPTILNNSQDTQLKSAFKKSYSSINQALINALKENDGVTYACYSDKNYNFTTSECTTFWAALKGQLRINKEYKGAVDGINIPDYTGIDLISAQGGQNVNSACVGGKVSAKVSKEAWALSDGSMLISYNTKMQTDGMFFILDTNGMKKPNKWGYDIFLLNFQIKDNNTAVIINDSLCGSIEKDGYWISDILIK